jgi:hypothetical protein
MLFLLLYGMDGDGRVGRAPIKLAATETAGSIPHNNN